MEDQNYTIKDIARMAGVSAGTQPHKSVLSSSLPGRSQKGSAIPAVIIFSQQVLK